MLDLDRASDEELMARYAGGAEDAFEALFRRYEAPLFSYFLRRTRCRERSADLYQELFLHLHRGRASFDPSRPLRPWLFQIARRLLVDDVRRAWRAREVPFGDGDEIVAEPEAYQHAEAVERADRWLAHLSSEERRVLWSAKVDGASYAEIAPGLGKSVDAVKKLASRAMQRLRRGERVGAGATTRPARRPA